MGNSKHRKNHKQKVAAFKKRNQDEKNKAVKFQRNLIMQLIEQEKNKGLFNQNPILDGPVIDGPIIDGPTIDPTNDQPTI